MCWPLRAAGSLALTIPIGSYPLNYSSNVWRYESTIIGGVDNPAREGLVSFWADAMPAEDIVAALNAEGIRTHTRKADHYSGNILDPLGQSACVRVSFCHYNSRAEVARFLTALDAILGRPSA